MTEAEKEQDPYEGLRRFRSSERAEMISAIRDFIEEARKRVKSNYTPARERAKWMRLAGQLIWYKDQILRSLSFEALEKEVDQLKKLVIARGERERQSRLPPVPRRTILGPKGTRRENRIQRRAPNPSRDVRL